MKALQNRLHATKPGFPPEVFPIYLNSNPQALGLIKRAVHLQVVHKEALGY